MKTSLVNIGPTLIVVLVLLVIIAMAVTAIAKQEQWKSMPWAAIRATLQLLALAGILTLIVDNLWLVTLFVSVMAWIAAWTSSGRVAPHRFKPGTNDRLSRIRSATWSLLPVAGFPIMLVVCLVLVGVVPANGIAIIPVAGIFIGNGMTLTTLTARRCHDELSLRHGEVDAALALGFARSQARLIVIRNAAVTALTPSIDSTRTVGVVTIPGAFVGMILGGASLIDAAVMQLFVMLGILAVAAVANYITTMLIAQNKV